eukprot:scaffold507_cov391-Prasinococcus_capsulatus_cf.AAC.11
MILLPTWSCPKLWNIALLMSVLGRRDERYHYRESMHSSRHSSSRSIRLATLSTATPETSAASPQDTTPYQ